MAIKILYKVMSIDITSYQNFVLYYWLLVYIIQYLSNMPYIVILYAIFFYLIIV